MIWRDLEGSVSGLEGLRRNTKILGQDCQCPDRIWTERLWVGHLCMRAGQGELQSHEWTRRASRILIVAIAASVRARSLSPGNYIRTSQIGLLLHSTHPYSSNRLQWISASSTSLERNRWEQLKKKLIFILFFFFLSPLSLTQTLSSFARLVRPLVSPSSLLPLCYSYIPPIFSYSFFKILYTPSPHP
jgi:hypothetical protein